MIEAVGSRAPDMTKFADFLQARRAEIENPKHAAMLDGLIEHSIAEVRDLDIDRTMATLAGDCVYTTTEIRPRCRPRACRGSCRAATKYGRTTCMAWRAAPSAWTGSKSRSSTSSSATTPSRGTGSYALVFPEARWSRRACPCPGEVRPEDDYVHMIRTAIVIPFHDGLMLGEDYYFDGQPTIEKLAS